MNKPQLEPDYILVDEATDLPDSVFAEESRLVQVAPGVFQSVEDYEANAAFDGERDERTIDELTK